MERHDMLARMRGIGVPYPTWRELQREAEKGFGAWPARGTVPEAAGSVLGAGADLGSTFDPFAPWALHTLPVLHRLGRTFDDFGVPRDDQVFHHCALQSMWEGSGRRVYVVDADTAVLLARTELPRFPASTLRFPLPVFYLVIPGHLLQIRDEDTGGWQEVEGLWVTCTQPDDPSLVSRSLCVMAAAREPARVEDEMSGYTTVVLTPAVPLDEVLFRELDRLGIRSVHDDIPAHQVVPRLVLGFALYLQSEHPRLEPVPAPPRTPPGTRNPKKIRRLEREQGRSSRFGYVYVGRGEATGPETARDASPVRSLTRPVWVAGHWREQAYGPGSLLRKRIWIKPHAKGPGHLDGALRALKVQPARPAAGGP